MSAKTDNHDAGESPPRIHVGMSLLLSAFLIALLAVMSWLYYVYPHVGIGPEQPIPFSHRVHAGDKEISCRFCHPFVERSSRAGIPAMTKCLFCHSRIIVNHPEIVKLRNYVENNKPVIWRRIFWIADHVKFNHQPHVSAGFDCAECHGDVKSMDRLMPVDLKMGFCVTCHRENDVNLDCWLACHKS
ncbi:MAG: cytochrome c3 family protein [Deltaproteobacteria bacterium]|nr:cytochrome c3 family protein [Deltaproteobacteria bacterium]